MIINVILSISTSDNNTMATSIYRYIYIDISSSTPLYLVQNVRRETSDLLTAINNYIYSDENDVDLVKMNLMSVREKSNLLILYFGPDKVENDKVDLLNKGDNISKNQHHFRKNKYNYLLL